MGDQMAGQNHAPRIRYTDRVFVTGTTGTGKTHLARRLFLAAPGRRIVIDPKNDRDATGNLGNHATASDPLRLPDMPTIRWVPRDPFDLEAYDALYRHLMEHPPWYIWTDELGTVAPANKTPPAFAQLIYQGRSRGIGHIGSHQRPVEISRAILSQSQHIVAFSLHDPDDRARIAKTMGLAPGEFTQYQAELGPHGFLWWQQTDPEPILCTQGITL